VPRYLVIASSAVVGSSVCEPKLLVIRFSTVIGFGVCKSLVFGSSVCVLLSLSLYNKCNLLAMVKMYTMIYIPHLHIRLLELFIGGFELSKSRYMQLGMCKVYVHVPPLSLFNSYYHS